LWVAIQKSHDCETTGLTLDKVIDSSNMSQMNVFQGLGHSYIADNYSMKFNGMMWPRGMMKWYDTVE
jgi:hypothetical protein